LQKADRGACRRETSKGTVSFAQKHLHPNAGGDNQIRIAVTIKIESCERRR
jgi:hypothetical protein